jgi:hypothetical protein
VQRTAAPHFPTSLEFEDGRGINDVAEMGSSDAEALRFLGNVGMPTIKVIL